MKIVVTQDHIDRGQVGRAQFCPIALACNEQHGTVHFVTGIDIDYCPDGCRTAALYKLPPEARKFVDDFDRGQAVSPFTFEAEPTFEEKDEPSID